MFGSLASTTDIYSCRSRCTASLTPALLGGGATERSATLIRFHFHGGDKLVDTTQGCSNALVKPIFEWLWEELICSLMLPRAACPRFLPDRASSDFSSSVQLISCH